MNTVEEDQKIIDAMRNDTIEAINAYLWDQRLDTMTREQLVDTVIHFYNKCEYLKGERNKILQDKVKIRDILNNLKDEEVN